MLKRTLGLALAAITLSATSVAAQVELKSKAMEVTLTGRVHLQWNTTSVDDEAADEISNEFLIRRARLTAELQINDWISGKIQPDYGEGEISLKDAYLRLAFDAVFRATFGQFKRPFDIFELTTSTKILVIERAGGIRGVDACGGPGGICSYSRFTEKLEYSDRDIGVMLDGTFGNGAWQYMAAMTNGAGANDEEENDTKSYSGRLQFMPIEDLMIAGNIGIHDYPNGITADDEYAIAFGGDIEWGNYNQGLHVQAGLTAGDNWKALDEDGDPASFVTAQGIVTYKVPVRDSRFIEAIEPVGRISVGDPDTDINDDEGFLFTPGVVVFFKDRNKIALNVDIWSPGEGDTEYSVKVQSYLHF